MIFTYLVFINIVIFKNYADCIEEQMKSKKPLPYFRRQVEELVEDSIVDTKTDDPQSNLVSFLVKNVKEIFNDVYRDRPTISTGVNEFTEVSESTLLFRPTTDIIAIKEYILNNISNVFRPTAAEDRPIKKYIFSNHARPTLVTHTDDIMILYENLTLTPLPFLIDKKQNNAKATQSVEDLTEKIELLNLTKDLNILGRAESKEHPNNISSMSDVITYGKDSKRSCVYCNNVAFAECGDPKNKLVPSIVCENEEDLCYSQHTPFGIVQRGCFSVNHNMTTYVCSCNLCNYMSIGETPFLFTREVDWTNNVIELSKTRRFRKSIFRDMSCLKCEVNTTAANGDMLSEANCLEGNIGSLPTQECKQNEICGIKAVRSSGYLWRGCIKEPLYNYWLTLCDSDLCNYDRVPSVYD